MTVAPPSRTMMPSAGNALVASTTKRAGCTGDMPAGAVSASSASSGGILLDPAFEIGDGVRGVSCSASTSCGTTPRRSPTSGTSTGRFTPMATGSCSTKIHLRLASFSAQCRVLP